MQILLTGVAKSGNFWLYRILQTIMDIAGWEQKSYIQGHPLHAIAKTWPLSNEDQANLDFIDITSNGCFFRISSVVRMPIEDIDAYLAKCSLVRSHSYFCKRSLDVIPKFDRSVYIIRDPRDVVISFANFAFTPYYQRYYPHSYKDSQDHIHRNLERKLWGWMHHVSGYIQHREELNLHVLFYERLKQDFQDEIYRLGTYLGMDLTPEQIHQVEEATSVQAMKGANPDHVRKGETGGWKKTLTPSQRQRARFSIAPILELLGYPLTPGKVDVAIQPFVPSGLTLSQLRTALRKSRARLALSGILNGQISTSSIAAVLKIE